ncbi:adenylate kinase 7-like [Myzus persicae]|uniref:adenylate kinase 7-like n=1 Tax=Myzus persicae TaxID=13164 RepID=UPI000B939778|nr:adenylate kinase 7-like [Myzus persicae]
MNSSNILTNDSSIFQFPTIFEYSYAHTHSKRLSQCGQSFSKNKCGVTIFDITNDSEIELEQARFSFNYIYNELINYSDEEIIRSKEKGINRKFILISTAMTWVKETCNNQIYSENEEVNTSFTEKNIFQTYIIGTGIIYGHEENALHHVFTSAWHNPKEMYITMLNRTVPVFHVDELVKLVFIVSKYDRVKTNYILAVEQESYGFNNIIRSMCDELYSMLDIIIPDNQILQTSIISNMKKLTLDFVEANKLYSLKIIVSGQPTHVSSNIAKRLAKYYKVQLINIPKLINNYFTSLKNDRIELELKINDLFVKRTNIKHALAKLIAQFDEWYSEMLRRQLFDY